MYLCVRIATSVKRTVIHHLSTPGIFSSYIRTVRASAQDQRSFPTVLLSLTKSATFYYLSRRQRGSDYIRKWDLKRLRK